MRKLFLALLFVAPLFAQISQLATTADGNTLLFHTNFRLQSETDLGAQGKIYRWQNGEFTRLAATFEINQGLRPDVFKPFLTSDGNIFGWQIQNGCSFCRFIIGYFYGSQLVNAVLPDRFPTGTIGISPNGRFFVADLFPATVSAAELVRNAKYLDATTGVITDLPLYIPIAQAVRQVSNDGTVVFILSDPQTKGSLALWKPNTQPILIYEGGQVVDAKISADNGRVAFEFLSLDPQRAGEHLLAVYSATGTTIVTTQTGQPNNMSGIFQPAWDTSGTNLLYRDFDPTTQTYALSLWNAATNTASRILTHPEGFANATISGDASTIWAVTALNRLLRANIPRGTIEEILPPLPLPGPVQGSFPVAGSALLIRGTAFNSANTVSLDGKELPVLAVSPEGIWVQVPWEYQQSVIPSRLAIGAPGNPFQTLVPFQISLTPIPQIVNSRTAENFMGFAKAAHQDFASLITPENPARSGETVHVYLTGLGPLDGPIRTGDPGPSSPPLHPLAPLRCFLDNSSVPLNSLTYAAGLIGFYQADITLPIFAAPSSSVLFCQSIRPDGLTSTSAYLNTAP